MCSAAARVFILPLKDVALSEGDRVIIAATRPTLTDALKSRDDIFGLKDLKSDDRSLADAVIAPASRMIGRSISQLTLQYETGCHVLGIQRRRRMIRTMLHNIRFEAGDVLLIVGSRQAIRDLSHTYDVFLLEWSATDLPSHMQSRKALAIFGTVVIAAATGFLPLVAAAPARRIRDAHEPRVEYPSGRARARPKSVFSCRDSHWAVGCTRGLWRTKIPHLARHAEYGCIPFGHSRRIISADRSSDQCSQQQCRRRAVHTRSS